MALDRIQIKKKIADLLYLPFFKMLPETDNFLGLTPAGLGIQSCEISGKKKACIVQIFYYFFPNLRILIGFIPKFKRHRLYPQNRQFMKSLMFGYHVKQPVPWHDVNWTLRWPINLFHSGICNHWGGSGISGKLYQVLLLRGVSAGLLLLCKNRGKYSSVFRENRWPLPPKPVCGGNYNHEGVTLKIRSRSPKSNKLLILSDLYRLASLVTFYPMVHEITCRQTRFG